MIRRETVGRQNEPRWLLIQQIDHAHLAGTLAEHWYLPIADMLGRDEVLWAIHHHDDGWAEWDREPIFDPRHGRPRAFTEMPLADSLAIWRKSIEIALDHGSLAAYMVAGHFSALLQRFDSWRNDAEQRLAAQQFLSDFAAQMEAWRGRLAKAPGNGGAEILAHAVAALQMFDALSLWLCVAERTAPEQFATPGGPVITVTPREAGVIELSPWPLSVTSLALGVEGRSIPARRYESAEDLAAAPVETARLAWSVRPALEV